MFIQVLDRQFIEQQPGRRDEIISLVANIFCQGEPLSQFLGIQCDQMKQHFVQHIVDKAIHDKLSLVCADNSNGRIAAVMLNEDFYDTMHPDEDFVEALVENFPEMLPVLELLEHLDQKLVEKRFLDGTLRPNRVLHAFMGATHKDYSGRGLAKQLRVSTAQLAKSHRYSYVCVEPTNPSTQHIWTRLGASIEYSLSTKDFEMSDGTKPFSKSEACVDRESSIVLLSI
jgi:ribosomal protein S18 acetylase RimI-like enzyme